MKYQKIGNKSTSKSKTILFNGYKQTYSKVNSLTDRCFKRYTKPVPQNKWTYLYLNTHYNNRTMAKSPLKQKHRKVK